MSPSPQTSPESVQVFGPSVKESISYQTQFYIRAFSESSEHSTV